MKGVEGGRREVSEGGEGRGGVGRGEGRLKGVEGGGGQKEGEERSCMKKTPRGRLHSLPNIVKRKVKEQLLVGHRSFVQLLEQLRQIRIIGKLLPVKLS